MPDLGIDKVEVVEILVKVHDHVSKEQGLIVVEGKKTSMEIPSPYDGIVSKIFVKVSDIVTTDFVIMLIKVENDKIQCKKTQITSDTSLNKAVNNICYNQSYNHVHATPLIRRLARLSNIDLTKITGSGRKNRILRKDIENYNFNIKDQLNNSGTKRMNNISNLEPFNFDQFGDIEIIDIDKIKIISGSFLFKSWSTIPHVTQFDEVDITELEEFRQKCNNMQDFKDNRLTLLSFIIKSVSKGLERFPYFNSSISLDNKKIFLKKYINIGIAVDTSYGLVVPVIKNVKGKTISEIAYDIAKQSKNARDKKLSISDCQGGCFTISSLGNIGGKFFTPIINSPEVAILGISKAFYQPYWTGTKFIPRLMLPLSLSYDHRIVNGADSVRFMTFISSVLNDLRLLLV
ncbi:dihydrolipoamide acetyltransferase [Buchnera aphidicola (Stegophylla sp.)]|uniref:Dihydrolipoamide acetyltransferase component of pyruvate dehydrogenase complex n=2 Tax=Buchnera aphidicola TaxID=9 RepID=A0A4D6YLK9_9GAMM|nr:dihydrolipoamide acetyltransferase [Buchnera aphidicola (Stegophylla sp.)]